ncbi:MAG TPA: ECF-type sigma factor [Nevskiaceae bacterium]|nr:ECF-type sigma factor [Nevskiaceae bacterium]
MQEVTQLLDAVRAGDRAAADRLFTAVYDELRSLARRRLARESTLTLEPAVLVNEAYLRLCRQPDLPGRDRRAFFAYAAGVMRSVIVDHVRARRAEKRGGDLDAITLNSRIENTVGPDDGSGSDAEALDAALADLAKVDPRCARVVELRFFGGLTEAEVAETLEISVPTVQRDWAKARAFLRVSLRR